VATENRRSVLVTYRDCRLFLQGILKLGGTDGRFVKPGAAVRAAEFDQGRKIAVAELIEGCLARGWIEATGKGVTVTEKGHYAIKL
jgi:hypothetical protein